LFLLRSFTVFCFRLFTPHCIRCACCCSHVVYVCYRLFVWHVTPLRCCFVVLFTVTICYVLALRVTFVVLLLPLRCYDLYRSLFVTFDLAFVVLTTTVTRFRYRLPFVDLFYFVTFTLLHGCSFTVTTPLLHRMLRWVLLPICLPRCVY
jgi:hypothetical protein